MDRVQTERVQILPFLLRVAHKVAHTVEGPTDRDRQPQPATESQRKPRTTESKENPVYVQPPDSSHSTTPRNSSNVSRSPKCACRALI